MRRNALSHFARSFVISRRALNSGCHFCNFELARPQESGSTPQTQTVSDPLRQRLPVCSGDFPLVRRVDHLIRGNMKIEGHKIDRRQGEEEDNSIRFHQVNVYIVR